MKLCPECYSDNIEKTSSVALRVIICLILIFIIPFGFFFCWVPFVFPHTYRCSNCYNNGKEDELLSVDWREREKIIEQEKAFKEEVLPLMEKWFEKDDILYKLSEWEQKHWLIEVTNEDTRVLRIKYYKDKTLYSDETDLQVLEYDLHSNCYKPTKLGETSFTDDELSFVVERNKESLRNYLVENNKLIEPFETKMGGPKF